MTTGRRPRLAICDLDGTLVDSDGALADAFVALGVPREEVTFGHVVVDECARWGIAVEDWTAAFDARSVQPYPGVDELVHRIDRWAVCSNRLRALGEDDLHRFGWHPDLALFAESFTGPKSPRPILDALGVDPADAVFLGDTAHDRACAREVGMEFALAAWNPRAVPAPGDRVLVRPTDLLDLLVQSD